MNGGINFVRSGLVVSFQLESSEVLWPLESELDRCSSSPSEQKRRRDAVCNNSSRSVDDVRQYSHDVIPAHNPTSTETDARDLLQLALDRICELQRKLMQPNSYDAGTPHEDLTGPHSNDSDLEDDDTDTGDDDDDDDNYNEVNNSFHDREVVLAGYEFCHKEALRFLVEEEQLGPEHPAVRELTAHLSSRRNTIDCSQVLANYLLLSSHSEDPINV
ncbi:nonsense-mediated mRNA decay protein 2 [Cryptotermes secundus]|uniref:nonsense-mediated mRNA decay protein 2 n=1 Tax=Cryptotermes secundus TaxID=105785 RepID=UPI001454B940|nr:nonsense-mediated mRNA decay protein 2 [Cryptotermes secundus]